MELIKIFREFSELFSQLKHSNIFSLSKIEHLSRQVASFLKLDIVREEKDKRKFKKTLSSLLEHFDNPIKNQFIYIDENNLFKEAKYHERFHYTSYTKSRNQLNQDHEYQYTCEITNTQLGRIKAEILFWLGYIEFLDLKEYPQVFNAIESSKKSILKSIHLFKMLSILNPKTNTLNQYELSASYLQYSERFSSHNMGNNYCCDNFLTKKILKTLYCLTFRYCKADQISAYTKDIPDWIKFRIASNAIDYFKELIDNRLMILIKDFFFGDETGPRDFPCSLIHDKTRNYFSKLTNLENILDFFFETGKILSAFALISEYPKENFPKFFTKEILQILQRTVSNYDAKNQKNHQIENWKNNGKIGEMGQIEKIFGDSEASLFDLNTFVTQFSNIEILLGLISPEYKKDVLYCQK